MTDIGNPEFTLEFNSSFRESEIKALAKIVNTFTASTFAEISEKVLSHLSKVSGNVQWIVFCGNNFNSWIVNLNYDIALSAKFRGCSLLIIKGPYLSGKVLPPVEDAVSRTLITKRIVNPLTKVHLAGMRRVVADYFAPRFSRVADTVTKYFKETFGPYLRFIVIAGRNLVVAMTGDVQSTRALIYCCEVDDVGLLVIRVAETVTEEN
ncbi:uncharacterized protein LOC111247427 isoform X2 [Varroa destructor]|uniref:Uncharacterized protein n=1 Tax=Varroa destructor TaxID=109461 RepID=A0A7M7JNY2_VARDE|nr:uncharacterized protein LOC111247427 isoform X2 [Varroa destructor]